MLALFTFLNDLRVHDVSPWNIPGAGDEQAVGDEVETRCNKIYR